MDYSMAEDCAPGMTESRNFGPDDTKAIHGDANADCADSLVSPVIIDSLPPAIMDEGGHFAISATSATVGALSRVLAGIDYEILFVDDDSTDRTAALVRCLAQTDPRIRVLQRIRRRGLASAVLEGFQASSANYHRRRHAARWNCLASSRMSISGQSE
jgi:hypothetical protein